MPSFFDDLSRKLARQEEPWGTRPGETLADARNRLNGWGQATGPHKADGGFDQVGAAINRGLFGQGK